MKNRVQIEKGQTYRMDIEGIKATVSNNEDNVKCYG